MEEQEKFAADLVCGLIRSFNQKEDMDSLRLLIAILMTENVSVPMTVSMEDGDLQQFLHAKAGDTVTTGGAIRMKPDMLENSAGERFFPAFTRQEEAPEHYRSAFSWITMNFMNCVHSAHSNPNCAGVVINGFSEPFVVNRALMGLMLDMEKK